MNFIDLFAGAGGLSEGFIKAGFNPIAHVEFDGAACNTLRTRAAYHYLKDTDQLDVYHAYLKGEIDREELYSCVHKDFLNSVIHAEIGKDNGKVFRKINKFLGDDQVDILIGGPPCQAYSYIGRAALKNRVKSDKRNKLYVQYGKFLRKYQPKVFVFENVPGIKTAGEGQYYRDLKKYFKKLGYEMDDRLLNASDYDVVQSRQRLIIIGWKKELQLTYPDVEASIFNNTRDDIFSDLPAIPTNSKNRIEKYSTIEPNEYLRRTELRNGVDFVTLHISRPHNHRDLEIYRLAINRLQQGERLKNFEIPEAQRTQSNVEDFVDRFKVVGEKPHTMIAHIAKDGHHFIHPDINQLRSISVREAARIQSFPDDYFFEGVKEYQNRTAAFKQIGNAVPPLMAYCIAIKLKEKING